ncbi:protein mono-ADP-ribosyltransferase PARP12 [Hemiscyllium ocellatum]|uniref:protein mono-ADP-ribosyltransferase PARP12 n=1 Tax=Hemiscyllium ocellatum TaxID=170820 RepID=UPI0029662219|nr:protein mono-ADP-ribosyltransferase PARP12 [Hemiscyllium ocellatum]
MGQSMSSGAAASSLNGKLFQWQIQDGSQWLDVAHDDIIEAQYTLPMVEGIRLHTTRYGTIYLDFDKMEIVGSNLKLKRLTFPPAQGMDEYSWYFLDDHSWREYGVQGTGRKTTLITSPDIEFQFRTAPQNVFNFNIGSSKYTIDFQAMDQTNVQSGMKRKVRRRSRFNSENQNPNSISGAVGHQPVSNSVTSCTWQFRGDHGCWMDYRRPGEGGAVCSINSQDIEQSYQQNPQGSLQFTAGHFQYRLDLSAMIQINLVTLTKRAVRRLQTPSLQGASGNTGGNRLWQFMDEEGLWQEYSQPGILKSVTSQDIERIYQKNPQGSMKFSAGWNIYSLDFSAMTQTNLTTRKVRPVRRL